MRSCSPFALVLVASLVASSSACGDDDGAGPTPDAGPRSDARTDDDAMASDAMPAIDGASPPPPPIDMGLPIDPALVGPEDITYVGSFDVPRDDRVGGEQGVFAYGGHALGFDPDADALFLGGHDWYQRLGEIAIPDSLSGTAEVLQDLADPTDGMGNRIDDSTLKLGGVLVDGDRLIFTVYSYYDADSTQTLSHFASSRDLSVSDDVVGPFAMTGGANARSVAGYMGWIPPEWRSTLGGSALTGNCCLSILGASSAGPSATVFEPADVGTRDPIPGTTVLFYPLGNETTRDGTTTNDIFVQSDQVAGIAFPPGTRSVLFIGRHGRGEYCYGPGTDDVSLHGMPDGEGNVWCHDPSDSSKGTHAFPYVHYVWAYDANDFVEVREGRREPWDVVPYATFTLDGIDDGGTARIAGATFDPDTGRLFLTERYGEEPRVHVLRIAVGE